MLMPSSPSRLTLLLALLTAILATSTSSVFIRYAQQDAPSLAIAALRLTFATLILAPFAVARHRVELRSLTRSDLGLALLSGLFLAAHFATWISSLEFTTVASSVVFVSTAPLWVALASPLFLHERLGQAAIAGLGLALAGGVLIAISDACVWNNGLDCASLSEALHGRAMWGNFLALAGAWTVAGYIVIGRKLRAAMSLLPYIFVVYGIAALTLLIVTVVAGLPLVGFRPATYGWILLMALVPQLVGHTTYNWVLRYLPAAVVSTANLGEPIGSATLAYLLLGESPAATKLVGAALILIGIYLVSRAKAA